MLETSNPFSVKFSCYLMATIHIAFAYVVIGNKYLTELWFPSQDILESCDLKSNKTPPFGLQNGGDQSIIIETSFTNLKNWELLSCSLHAITVATLPCFPSEFREDQEQCVCTGARASSQQQQMSRSVWLLNLLLWRHAWLKLIATLTISGELVIDPG